MQTIPFPWNINNRTRKRTERKNDIESEKVFMLIASRLVQFPIESNCFAKTQSMQKNIIELWWWWPQQWRSLNLLWISTFSIHIFVDREIHFIVAQSKFIEMSEKSCVGKGELVINDFQLNIYCKICIFYCSIWICFDGILLFSVQRMSNVCARVYVWVFVRGEMSVKGDAFARR